MWKRIIGYLKALFGIKMDQWEDPDVLLKQAQDEMNVAHAKNRELAVQAIAQKNQLQQQVDDYGSKITNLQAKAEMALKNGDQDLALQLLREKQSLESAKGGLDTSLVSATARVEQIKVAMKREEEMIRTKAAQAMAMKTQWKQAQIEASINKSFESMTMSGQDAVFERAANRINAVTNQNAARTELGKDSLDSKLASLDNQVGDQKAAAELEAMQVRLGLKPASDVAPSTAHLSTEEEIAQLTVGH